MLKLDGATGEVLWSQHYAGTDGLDEAALAVAVGAQDEVFFCGRATRPNVGMQMLAMRLDATDGHVVWSSLYGRTAARDDVAWDLVVGQDGHPVIAGVAALTSGAVCAVRQLDAGDGSLRWHRELAGALDDFTNPGTWLALLDGGDVAVCQRAYGANGYDVVLARCAGNDGTPAWTVRYDGPTHGGDNPRSMIRDAAGDLLVTGVQDAFWNYNYMLLKFSGTTGALAWQAPAYDGPPGWYDAAACVAVGPGGVILVAGLSDGTGTGWDMATVGYDPAGGAILWDLRHDGPAGESDEARDLAVSSQGDIYVTGYGYGLGTGKDHVTLRYLASPPSGVPTVAAGARLEPAYPNPFNPRTTIAFTLAEAGRVRLAVYGVDGRRVRTLHDGPCGAGRQVLAWDGRDGDGRALAAGVYVYLLDTGGERLAGTATLVK